MKPRIIEAFPIPDGSWRIRVDREREIRTTDFVSERDVRLWLENMQNNGLYLNDTLIV